MDEVLGDVSTQTATREVARLRTEHPDAAISVERSSIIPRQKRSVVRFKIQEKDDLYYSAVFPVEQQDDQYNRIRKLHPDAEITPEVWEV
jgi:hypothetical protein